jgi:2-oxo-4-hydroxy-4-carboxy-5-ureidoimidazoline decarboxylase
MMPGMNSFMSTPTTASPHFSLDEVNAMSEVDFVALVGALFEHSPWIARETWPQRPFTSRQDLLARLTATLRGAALERKIDLIRAHPDLAGRLARQGDLTRDSTQEQASAGLDRLLPDEVKLFEEYNRSYQARFGFPFVICARLNDKKTILLAFQRRLQLSRADEIETALEEIEKIAALRLGSLLRA